MINHINYRLTLKLSFTVRTSDELKVIDIVNQFKSINILPSLCRNF